MKTKSDTDTELELQNTTNTWTWTMFVSAEQICQTAVGCTESAKFWNEGEAQTLNIVILKLC